MAIMRWNPLRELENLNREVSRLFNDYNMPFTGTEPSTDFLTGTWTPRVDIYEDENKIVVSTALPGMDQKDIKVNIDKNMLTISGARKLRNEDKKDNYTRIEQFYGSFTRSFTLPGTVNQEGVNAKMEHGVLEITLPKKEEAKPKMIEVKVH